LIQHAGDDLDLPIYPEIIDILKGVAVEFRTITLNLFNFVQSLIDLYRLADKIVSIENESVINTSTNFLPGILALKEYCALMGINIKFCHMRHDNSAHWKNREFTIFNPTLNNNLGIELKHLTFLDLLEKITEETKNPIFTTKELIKIIDENCKLLGYKETYSEVIQRKRFYSFTNPLLDLIIT
jgi:hypothetical protein